MSDVVREIRRATRHNFSADEKIRIVLASLKGETPVSEICRREGIAPSIYYRGSKQFLEAGKNSLTREAARNATDDKIRELKIKKGLK